MSSVDCILAIDQGTTSSRAIVFDRNSNIIALAQKEFPQHYPADGWVEHEPEDIWSSTVVVCREAVSQAIAKGKKLAAIGVTNQRETTLIWDRVSGEPIYNAIVWQDRRTAQQCQQLAPQLELVQQRTGLLLDPYFSATKIAWILDNVPGARKRAEKGELAFGTVDTFLIWRLTGGKVHATDTTNASRTNLFNIETLQWDPQLLELFNVPADILPEVKESTEDYGHSQQQLLGMQLPIAGVAGDQQAAMVGQCCFSEGAVKSTYGTGCFSLTNTGSTIRRSRHKLLSTVAYSVKGTTHYATEGSIFIAGASIQWLRDGLKVIEHAKDTKALAESLSYDHGVFMVPAFAGMGAPHWVPEARAAIYGLTRGGTEAHLARAALESVCFQTHDLYTAAREDGVESATIKVDGGMVANDWLCQFLSDILMIPVQRPQLMETTALGAAYLAGLQIGLFEDEHELERNYQVSRIYTPNMDADVRKKLLTQWQKAVEATLAFSR